MGRKNQEEEEEPLRMDVWVGRIVREEMEKDR